MRERRVDDRARVGILKSVARSDSTRAWCAWHWGALQSLLMLRRKEEQALTEFITRSEVYVPEKDDVLFAVLG